MTDIDTIMRLAPVIPVLTVEDLDVAAPLAQALASGGLRALELTLRTPAALAALTAMTRAAPDAVIGAGTVLNPDDLRRAVDAGARFIVSPGLTERLTRAADEAGVPLLPGVATAGDVLRGLELGLDRFKFFPAESSGGVPALAAFNGPFARVAFCPTGGLTLANAPSYLASLNVLCVGGSWVAPRTAVEARDWAKIKALACEAAGLRAGPSAAT